MHIAKCIVLDGSARRVSYTDQLDGSARRISLYIVAASESDEGLVYVKADFLHFRVCKKKKTNTHTHTSIYENGMSVQHLPCMISLWHNFVVA